MSRRLRRRYGRAARLDVRLARAERLLEHAINSADKRGYTGFAGGKGGLFEDPVVKRRMKQRDKLLKMRGKRGAR